MEVMSAEHETKNMKKKSFERLFLEQSKKKKNIKQLTLLVGLWRRA